MPKHNQIEITIYEDYIIEVDEGLEEIIENFFHWDIPTISSCVDNNGSIWIAFPNYHDWEKFLQLALKRSNESISEENHDLWSFIQEYGQISLPFQEAVVNDPNHEGNVIGLGVVDISVSLRFPKELLNDFKELFFEALPPK